MILPDTAAIDKHQKEFIAEIGKSLKNLMTKSRNNNK